MLFHIFISDWDNVPGYIHLNGECPQEFPDDRNLGAGEEGHTQELQEVQEKCQVLAMAQNIHRHRLRLAI